VLHETRPQPPNDSSSAAAAGLAPLPPAFYLRDAATVAKALLGKGLYVRGRGPDGRLEHRGCLVEIVEVEAYLGESDPASHAANGPTPRSQVMFEAGGICYAYLSYGVNICMNVVTGAAGEGQAVLLRAAAPLWNWRRMLERRELPTRAADEAAPPLLLLNGPGKLTKSLGITLAHNSLPFDRPDFKLVDLGRSVPKAALAVSPRIGISKARDLPLRFFIAGSPWVSRPRGAWP
jgi:DNA-3-methyladenine glycosylase